MRISGLNHKITFEKRVVENVNGFEIEKWIKYRNVWASANGLFGSEYYRAKEVGEQNTVQFEIYYSHSLSNLNTKDYRIIFRKQIYDIEYLDNVRFENESIKVKAIRRD